ncbi:MAG: AAA family ATPase [Candidatus Bipolaricaulota bacterium]|nr:MAG: AAA family ATPase [Candidatus Bipolaricaulota bacterium]
MVNELHVPQLRRVCDAAAFDFATTADIEPLDRIIGQERAIEALKLGLGIKDAKNRYNIYVAGGPGTGKMSAVESFLSRVSRDEEVPPDLCYVHNFESPHTPRYLELPAGKGCSLRDDMTALITRLKREIPKVFESDEFKARSKKIGERYTERRSKLLEEMEKQSRDLGFAIQRTPIGINTLPLREGGEPLSQEEYEALSEEERGAIREKQGEVQTLVQERLQEIARIDEEREEEVKKLAKEAVLFMIEPHFRQLSERYGEIDKAVAFLTDVRKDIADNLQQFEQTGNQTAKRSPFPFPVPQDDPFKRYAVNVLVDNCATEGAPVIVEQNATYTNLFGTIERRMQMGMAITDYSMIKPGSLHRANGGYLVLNANNLFRVGLSWEALKIAIKRREIRIEDPLQMLGYSTTEGLKPEPIPFRMKVIIIGSPQIYELLHFYDEDFPKLFSVKSDFGVEMERSEENERALAQFVRARCDEDEALLPFAPSGIAGIVEFASEIAGDQQKLTCRFGNLTSIIKEASYWATAGGDEVVSGDHVRAAIEQRDNRRNRIEEKIREMIARGQILVDTEGEAVGQVNGLAVLQLGDYAFGKPSRITASAHAGKGGIVDIEREAELGGHTHTKGIMILKGFLGERFAAEKPLSLAASLTFEQSYSMVDGDSASSTELYALLSSLSGVPVRQGIAVTGSVNQKGEIQPIGGVNEKIEGFFRVCKELGLSGDQGVMIPAKNVDNLMLASDVVEAVDAGRFHVYAVHTVEEGIETLTGLPAGEPDEDGVYDPETVFGRVVARLEAIREALKEEKEDEEREGSTSDGEAGASPQDESPDA